MCKKNILFIAVLSVYTFLIMWYTYSYIIPPKTERDQLSENRNVCRNVQTSPRESVNQSSSWSWQSTSGTATSLTILSFARVGLLGNNLMSTANIFIASRSNKFSAQLLPRVAKEFQVIFDTTPVTFALLRKKTPEKNSDNPKGITLDILFPAPRP